MDSRRIIVNQRQRNNPILASLTNVPYEFGEIPADYQVGKSTSVIFLSLRYHALKPEYIHERLKGAGSLARCVILLLLVDSKDLDNFFNEVNKLCVTAGISLIMAFSNEEAAQYLETLKLSENKPPDALMGKRQTDQLSAAVDFLTSIKPVNKSDALLLIKTFRTLNNILSADKKALSVVPGLGQRKVEALYKAIHRETDKGSKQTVMSQFFASQNVKCSGDISSSNSDCTSVADAVIANLPEVDRISNSLDASDSNG